MILRADIELSQLKIAVQKQFFQTPDFFIVEVPFQSLLIGFFYVIKMKSCGHVFILPQINLSNKNQALTA